MSGNTHPQRNIQMPGCYRLKVLKSGDILALGIHSWGDYMEPNKIKRFSRIYRLSPEGALKWSFPKEGPAPMSLIYMDVDPDGRRVAVLTESRGANAPSKHRLQPGGLYVLNAENGSISGHYNFKPLKPYFDKVSFWKSVSVGAKGELAAVGMFDGRSFIFDLAQARPLKTFNCFSSITLQSNKYSPSRGRLFEPFT